ncbi:hypothetical protein Acor_22820 [Acrocarpospora corrugata]|uniref:Uncharacterized protein n=1 Tax=Acrocarpospora corrugata TaxID=35763 RepID=A0A5M3VVK5_9ACTN|nr:hypothetical protein [Acrocarpospora corrugata]GES00219.1 hypothetical protein Acor_22820 [Acrocarpospora corrugata]
MPKLTPAVRQARKARKKRLRNQLRQAINEQKAERAERHATDAPVPRDGAPRTRRASRR